MVGTLTILKMLHCKSITNKKVSSEQKKDTGSKRRGISRAEKVCDFDVDVDVKVEDINELCRVCLREGRIPIYGNSTTEDLPEALTTIGAIEVSIDDPYPKYICQPCHALLQGAILFRKTAQQSDKSLKKRLLHDPEPEMDEHFSDYTEDHDEKIPTELDKQKPKTPKFLNCKKCNLYFNSFQEYSNHRLSAEHENKRMLCLICKKTYAAQYFHRHMTLHKQEAPFMCDICGKSFVLQSQFSRHHLTHSFDLPFKCSLCPYKGRFSESLKMHMRSHTGEKPYQCAQCPSRFISKSNLNKHVLTHKGEHDFRCETCGRGFYTRRELEMHFKVYHTGIKEHICKICKKPFGYRKQLMKHERQVHKREKLKSGRMPIYLKLESMKQQDKDITLET